MPRLKIDFNYHMQWVRYKKSCQVAALNYAALAENISDPFTYARTLKDLQFGYIELPELQKEIGNAVKYLSGTGRKIVDARTRSILTT